MPQVRRSGASHQPYGARRALGSNLCVAGSRRRVPKQQLEQVSAGFILGLERLEADVFAPL